MNFLDASGLVYLWGKIKENINEAFQKKADLDLEGKIPIGQLPVGSTSQHGALKVKEGNGLAVIGGVVSLQLIEVTAPVQEGTLTYTGAELSPTWGGYDTEKMTISGTTSSTEAGSHTVTFSLFAHYKWEDGSTGAKNVNWSIERAVIPNTPMQSGTLTYTKSKQSPKWDNFNSKMLTLSGTDSGTNAGIYKATFTPTDNYKWSNGSTGSKVVNWTIGKSAGNLNISATTGSVVGTSGGTYQFTFTKVSTGSVSVTSNNTKIATVSISGSTVTVKGVASGTATITVTVAQDTNYNAISKTHTATVVIASSTFDSNTWTVISKVAKTGKASSIWKVGDTKSFTLNSTSNDGNTYYCQILGFDHDVPSNSSTYGRNKAGITLQFGKVEKGVTKGGLYKIFYKMNSTATNVGGWKDCEMRTSVLATFLKWLPSDLKTAIVPVSKKTTAGNQSSNLVTTSDSLFLLSYSEVFASEGQSGVGEGSRYAFYVAGNTNIRWYIGKKYIWWTRSPAVKSTDRFCYISNINNDGGSREANTTNIGLTFGFCL